MSGWGLERKLDLNPRFFHYPSLVIYAQLLGQALLYLGMKLWGVIDSTLDFRVLYITEASPFYVAGRLITVIFGAGTVWLVYLLSRAVAGFRAALLASSLLAINAFHISKSQVIEVDVPLAFFSTLTLWAGLRLLASPTLRNYLISGLALGLSASTKYTGALLILPLIVAHLYARRKIRRQSHSPKTTSILRHPTWKLPCLMMLAAVLAFLITSPFVLLDASTFWFHFSSERQHMRLGHFGIDETSSWAFYAQLLTDALLGWSLALLALFGAVYLTIFRHRSWAIVLSAFLVPYLAAVASWSMKADRYLLPILPVAIVIATGAFEEVLKLNKLDKM